MSGTATDRVTGLLSSTAVPVPSYTHLMNFGAANLPSTVAMANDWPSGTYAAGFQGSMPFVVNYSNTTVQLPTTGSDLTSTGSSDVNELSPGFRNISSASTGYSVQLVPCTSASSAGFAMVSVAIFANT